MSAIQIRTLAIFRLIMNDKITTIFTIRRTIDKLMNDDVIHNYIFKIKVNYFHVLSPQSSQLKNGTKYQPKWSTRSAKQSVNDEVIHNYLCIIGQGSQCLKIIKNVSCEVSPQIITESLYDFCLQTLKYVFSFSEFKKFISIFTASKMI